MSVSQEMYERVALEEGDEIWELHGGRLVERPPMTVEQNDAVERLYRRLAAQLPADAYAIRSHRSRLRSPSGSNYVPDLFVVPRAFVREGSRERETLEVFDRPALLVVEVSSRVAGGYDVRAKLPDYRMRSDGEIWLAQPHERKLTISRRQPDGSYTESSYAEGMIELAAMSGIRIDVAALWRA